MTIPARPTQSHPGAPLQPTGDPMKDGLGAAAWAQDRADRVDLTVDGRPRFQPMRTLSGWTVEGRHPDPRGWKVVGDDGVVAGLVADLWVDLSEPQVRYLEVELAEGAGQVLLPIGYARIRARYRDVAVKALHARHFAEVPRTREGDRVTLLEEDRIVAYYAGGYRYAEPSRNEPYI
jgi:photosynthetic reaction center H subunit